MTNQILDTVRFTGIRWIEAEAFPTFYSRYTGEKWESKYSLANRNRYEALHAKR